MGLRPPARARGPTTRTPAPAGGRCARPPPRDAGRSSSARSATSCARWPGPSRSELINYTSVVLHHARHHDQPDLRAELRLREAHHPSLQEVAPHERHDAYTSRRSLATATRKTSPRPRDRAKTERPRGGRHEHDVDDDVRRGRGRDEAEIEAIADDASSSVAEEIEEVAERTRADVEEVAEEIVEAGTIDRRDRRLEPAASDEPDLVLDATGGRPRTRSELGGWDTTRTKRSRSSRQSPYDRPGRWYVVHTYSGYENKVSSNLNNVVTSRGMEDRVFEVVIPMEDVDEFKGGKKVTVQKKVFPGYLLVRCDLDDDTWGAIRNTPGVTGFVGPGHQAHAAVAPRGREHPPGQGRKAAGRPPKRTRPASSTRSTRRSGSRKARSPTSRARSPRSTRTSSSSRCWSTSSAGRPRSSSSSARSRSSRRTGHATRRRRVHDATEEEVLAVVKIQLEAGSATPAPPVGTALGPHGVQTMEFCKQYNAATETSAAR